MNLNDELTDVKIDKIRADYNSLEIKPSVMIVTPYDKRPGMFSKKISTSRPAVMNALIQYSKYSLSLFFRQMSEDPFDDEFFKSLFVVSNDAYHFLIHLKKEFVVNITQGIDYDPPNDRKKTTAPKNMAEKLLLPIVDFDPVEKYLKQLRNGYSRYADFYYDSCGGRIIMGVLKEDTFRKIDMTGHQKRSYCSKMDEVIVSSDKSFFEPNLEAIIESMEIMGQDIIERIEVKHQNILLSQK